MPLSEGSRSKQTGVVRLSILIRRRSSRECKADLRSMSCCAYYYHTIINTKNNIIYEINIAHLIRDCAQYKISNQPNPYAKITQRSLTHPAASHLRPVIPVCPNHKFPPPPSATGGPFRLNGSFPIAFLLLCRKTNHTTNPATKAAPTRLKAMM
jgi:hypothetical protein